MDTDKNVCIGIVVLLQYNRYMCKIQTIEAVNASLVHSNNKVCIDDVSITAKRNNIMHISNIIIRLLELGTDEPSATAMLQ